jgi:hypothetical protein
MSDDIKTFNKVLFTEETNVPSVTLSAVFVLIWTLLGCVVLKFTSV